MKTTVFVRPTIAIVGLRCGQAAIVQEQCGDVAALKFVNADQSKTVLPACDFIFLLTKFIHHGWTQASLKQLPRNRVELHRGGISSLVKRIRSSAERRIKT